MEKFRWERQLSKSFERSARPNLWSRRSGGTWIRAQESTCSEGRADLVWGRFDAGFSPRDLRRHAALLQNPSASRILATLQRAPGQSEESIFQRIGVSRPVFRKWLAALVDAGLVKHSSENAYCLKSPRLPRVEICSFELKLYNWQRALYQATRYRSFSHRVFVVMPADSADLAFRHREMFERANVGLVSHDLDGASRILVRPQKRPPHATHRTIMAIGMLSASNLKSRP